MIAQTIFLALASALLPSFRLQGRSSAPAPGRLPTAQRFYHRVRGAGQADEPSAVAAAPPRAPSVPHRAGFVSIVGVPNVGKSTLMNALLGERLSIITSKAQTTRHRIMGILNGDDFQIVYSDTPGVLIPQYKLQEGMMRFVQGSINDADVVIVVVDVFQQDTFDEKLLRQLGSSTAAMLVLLNKVDLLPRADGEDEVERAGGSADGSSPDHRAGQGESGAGDLPPRQTTNKALGTQEELVTRWQNEFPEASVLPISARYGDGLGAVLERVTALLPVHPPFYPKDQLSDKPVRPIANLNAPPASRLSAAKRRTPAHPSVAAPRAMTGALLCGGDGS